MAALFSGFFKTSEDLNPEIGLLWFEFGEMLWGGRG